MQITILTGICLTGEIINKYTHIPIPGNVLGMCILFLLLCLKIVKPEQIKEASGFLLGNLAFFFVPGAAAIIIYYGVISKNIIAFIAAIIISSIITFVSTAYVVQLLRKRRKRDGCNE